MKILFCARPSFGHVYPLMPLAAAARDANHQLAFATSGPFRGRLESWGYPTHDVGMSIPEACQRVFARTGRTSMIGPDGRTDAAMGGRVFIDELAPRTAADLTPLLAALEPDLVVYEPGDLGAGIAAHLAGVRAIGHAISPPMPVAFATAFVGDRLDRLWRDHGVDDPPFDLFTGEAYIDIFPGALRETRLLTNPARIPMRPVPFADPDAASPGWLGRTGRPLVYLTMGTVVANDRLLATVVSGLAGLDVDVLVALGNAPGTELGPLPPNVHVEAFVDQSAVLRHADLAVHHGGSGTMLGALFHGVPQLVLPQGADQFINADAVGAAGLGFTLAPDEITADRVAELARRALAEHRPAIAAARDEIMAMPHPVTVLEDLAARYARVPAGL